MTSLALDRLLLSYSSGLLAAVSPCVLVLIPLVVFRFVRSPDKPTASANASPGHAGGLRAIALFVLGFQCSYLLFGFALSEVLTSSIQMGFRLGLGGLFITICALSVTGHLDPLRIPLFKSTFLLGGSFALLITFSPCTVPFLGVLLALNTADAMIALIAFGQGLLTPALIAVFVGRRFTRCLSRNGRCMSILNTIMSYFLGASGLYLLLYRGGNPLEWIGLGGGGDAGAAGADGAEGGGGGHESGGGSAGTVKIIEFGDSAVMAAIWSAGVLLAAHALEFIDFTVKCGAGRRLVYLLMGVTGVASVWMYACNRVFAHDLITHKDWALAMSSAVSISDTAKNDAPATDEDASYAAPSLCVDTSHLHCDACDLCLYSYAGLIAAVVAIVVFAHSIGTKWILPADSSADISTTATTSIASASTTHAMHSAPTASTASAMASDSISSVPPAGYTGLHGHAPGHHGGHHHTPHQHMRHATNGVNGAEHSAANKPHLNGTASAATAFVAMAVGGGAAAASAAASAAALSDSVGGLSIV